MLTAGSETLIGTCSGGPGPTQCPSDDSGGAGGCVFTLGAFVGAHTVRLAVHPPGTLPHITIHMDDTTALHVFCAAFPANRVSGPRTAPHIRTARPCAAPA